jgi:hypothetical protein
MIVSKDNLHLIENAGDRREVRNFQRFLALWPHHRQKMLTRPRWQRYLNVTPEEAQRMRAARPAANFGF